MPGERADLLMTCGVARPVSMAGQRGWTVAGADNDGRPALAPRHHEAGRRERVDRQGEQRQQRSKPYRPPLLSRRAPHAPHLS